MAHGLMFHYFHNEFIPRTQGSLSSKQFINIIDKYSRNYNILPASDFANKAINGRLQSNDVCITFDDGLFSQYAIADNILSQKGLTAFYFVYTSPMDGILEKMEVYREYRNRYESIDDFYDDFFVALIEFGNSIGIDYKSIMNTDEAKNYFAQYDYYSPNDRLFRYLRNEILVEKYDEIMGVLMDRNGFNPEIECKNIWITPEQLLQMNRRGDIIGLHSHTHFTSLKDLSFEKKRWEYSTNKKYIEKIIQDKVNTASYPCDTYDLDTDKILSSLDINIAFIAHYEDPENNKLGLDLHRIPRIDASSVLKNI